MPNATNRIPAVTAVLIESHGYTYLAVSAPDGCTWDGPDYREDEQAAYCSGRLIPSCRPVRPVRCYEGARS
jgi:hypothetical protein